MLVGLLAAQAAEVCEQGLSVVLGRNFSSLMPQGASGSSVLPSTVWQPL